MRSLTTTAPTLALLALAALARASGTDSESVCMLTDDAGMPDAPATTPWDPALHHPALTDSVMGARALAHDPIDPVAPVTPPTWDMTPPRHWSDWDAPSPSPPPSWGPLRRRGLSATETHPDDERTSATHPHAATWSRSVSGKAYTLGAILGEGGFATVYRGHPQGDAERKMAIKCIDVLHPKKESKNSSLIKEFEYQVAATHPYVVRAHDYVKYSTGHECLVMELATGGNLKKMMAAQKEGALYEAQAKPLFYKLLLAFRRLHAIPIAHRDVKLENVLLMADGTPKLADFGLSTYADTNPATARDRNRRCGTRKYFPPEFANKSVRIVDPRPADPYEIGVTLRTALTGIDPSLVPAGDVRASDRVMQYLSRPVRELIAWMTHPEPARRCTPAVCLTHAWFDAVREAGDAEASGRLRALMEELDALRAEHKAAVGTDGLTPPVQLTPTTLPAKSSPAPAPAPAKEDKHKHHGFFSRFRKHHDE